MTTPDRPAAPERTVYLVASGDLRESANRTCWPAQADMEARLERAVNDLGYRVRRAHPYDAAREHGFISSQRMGMNVFKGIPKDAPLIVAEAVWQYSHHVLAGLRDHTGPVLTVANWSGEWPGLVGLLNLNGSLTKMNRPYSSLWSERFDDAAFRRGLEEWLTTGRVTHDTSHCRDLDATAIPDASARAGRDLAATLRDDKAIIGVFDEGCMGMYNAIIDDEMLNPMGVYKERLSQSALVAEMRRVSDADAESALAWLEARGMKFAWGTDAVAELTREQTLEQLKMYVAAARIADDFGCDAIGIQYQQGLKDTVAASDLAEGLLNDANRPPVTSRDGTRVLFEGRPIPHFNEVDEGAAVDALVTNRAWTALGLDPTNTLHDLRWGEDFDGQFVWVLQISGAAPAAHLQGGYAGATSERQPPMYFPFGGGTLKGAGRPGEIVWSRVYVQEGAVHADLGRGRVIELPEAETRRRWAATTPQWPLVSAVLNGVTRDQMMARHKANHVHVAYAPDAATADRALGVKAAMLDALGARVHLCGDAAPR